MWEIWANQLLPKALKSGPKSNKSPNLVTLIMSKWATPNSLLQTGLCTNYVPKCRSKKGFLNCFCHEIFTTGL